MGRKGKSLSIPGVDKVEAYRAHTWVVRGSVSIGNKLHVFNIRVVQNKNANNVLFTVSI